MPRPLPTALLLVAGWQRAAKRPERPPGVLLAEAAVTYVDLDTLPKLESLADGFKESLVRPPGEAPNSAWKVSVNGSSIYMLTDEELKVLDDYDEIFEKYSLFCNGRWLGAQVLQDSQDLMYLQHIVYKKKPDVIVETGTYKGGLTYFFASILDWIDREQAGGGSTSQILSLDRHHPDMVYAANWFCPVCVDCIKPYETDVWHRKVRFIQGMADADDTFNQVLDHMYELGHVQIREGAAEDRRGDDAPQDIIMDASKTVVVNLDANHEYEGLLKELFYYAPMVSENSYLIVQDAKLDKIWGTKGPTAALERFLSFCPEGEFIVEPELKFHAYSQHIYLRRARVTVGHLFFFQKVLAAQEAAESAARAASEEQPRAPEGEL